MRLTFSSMARCSSEREMSNGSSVLGRVQVQAALTCSKNNGGDGCRGGGFCICRGNLQLHAPARSLISPDSGAKGAPERKFPARQHCGRGKRGPQWRLFDTMSAFPAEGLTVPEPS